MKLSTLTEAENLTLLLEANLFNNQLEHGGTSLQQFAAFYGDMLDTDNNKKAFIKKITKLLINDSNYHHAMRPTEVPADAPDWAHESSQKGDLVYFMPDTGLKQKMEHLTHWINALEHDAKQNQDKDKKAFATKELQGFGKVESFDVLDQKANKYFARGSKKAQGDISGLEPRLDAGGGYTWYEITEPDAFAREGKVLQNCIGSHYTASSLARSNQKIYVLKNPQGETSVAIRTDEGSKTINEIKGKQNKPPVEKYMPPVQKFIEKSKLGMSEYGKHDLERAGYFWIRNNVYTKTDAIKEFFVQRPIGKLGYGLELVKVSAPTDAQTLLGNVYGKQQRYGGPAKLDGGVVFEARRDNHPVLSGVVNSGILHHLLTHSPNQQLKESIILEAAAVDKITKDGVEFINGLAERELIHDVSSDLQKTMFWKNHLKWDGETHRAIPRGDNANTVEVKKSPTKKWEVHKGPSAVQSVMHSIASTYSYNAGTVEKMKKAWGDVHEIHTIYLADTRKKTDDEPEWVMVVVDKDGKGHPHEITLARDGDVALDPGHTFAGGRSGNLAETPKVQSVIALANHHGFDLPSEFNMLHNVSKNTAGQHSSDELKGTPVGDEVKGRKFDLTGKSDEDKLKAVYHLLHGEFHGGGNEFPLKSSYKAKNKQAYHVGDLKTHQARSYHDHGEESTYVKPLLKDSYKDPDAVYGVTVNYGGNKTHEVMMFVKGNKITTVDDNTDKHKWQHWQDNNDVVDQLNTFAEEQGLKFATGSIRGQEELTVDGKEGKAQTAEQKIHKTIMRQRERGNYGKEGTDEIVFDDNSKFERASAEENSRLLNQMPYGARGEVWKFIDKNGENKGNILVSKNKVKGTYGPAWDDMSDWEKNRLSGKEVDKAKAHAKKKPMTHMYDHLKTAAKKFGWTFDTKTDEYEKDSPEYKLMKTLYKEDDAVTRTQAYNFSGLRYNAPSLSSKKAFDKKLQKSGLVDISQGRHANRAGDWTRQYDIKLTPAGRALVDKIDRDGKGHAIDVAGEKETHKDWKIPEKKKEDKKKATTSTTSTTRTPRTRASRTGGATKAQQALDLYTQMYADNDDEHPSRQDFISAMQEAPFNMSKSGAATYHYNTKKKFNAQQEVNEALIQSLLGLERLIVG